MVRIKHLFQSPVNKYLGHSPTASALRSGQGSEKLRAALLRAHQLGAATALHGWNPNSKRRLAIRTTLTAHFTRRIFPFQRVLNVAEAQEHLIREQNTTVLLLPYLDDSSTKNFSPMATSCMILLLISLDVPGVRASNISLLFTPAQQLRPANQP